MTPRNNDYHSGPCHTRIQVRGKDLIPYEGAIYSNHVSSKLYSSFFCKHGIELSFDERNTKEANDLRTVRVE